MSAPIQPAAARFDHVALLSRDSTASAALFEDLLGLRRGERPDFGFPGHWLYGADGACLHLVEAPGPDCGLARFAHLAFRVEEPGSRVAARLAAAGLLAHEARSPDGRTAQLFARLPGGLLLEIDAPADRDAGRLGREQTY